MELSLPFTLKGGMIEPIFRVAMTGIAFEFDLTAGFSSVLKVRTIQARR
jgi:hypothetical protein